MKAKERKRPRLARLMEAISFDVSIEYRSNWLYISDLDEKWTIEYDYNDCKEIIRFTQDEWKTSKEITINDVKKIAKNYF